jgi:hypothetical protein
MATMEPAVLCLQPAVQAAAWTHERGGRAGVPAPLSILGSASPAAGWRR